MILCILVCIYIIKVNSKFKFDFQKHKQFYFLISLSCTVLTEILTIVFRYFYLVLFTMCFVSSAQYNFQFSSALNDHTIYCLGIVISLSELFSTQGFICVSTSTLFQEQRYQFRCYKWCFWTLIFCLLPLFCNASSHLSKCNLNL